jgi:hypothetical protein
MRVGRRALWSFFFGSREKFRLKGGQHAALKIAGCAGPFRAVWRVNRLFYSETPYVVSYVVGVSDLERLFGLGAGGC